jgi:agmatinase
LASRMPGKRKRWRGPVNLHSKQFLDCNDPVVSFDSAAVAVLPVPYEGGVSYGKGTANAPDAVIEASRHLELYDEALKVEPHRMGIVTVMPPEIPNDPALLQNAVYHRFRPHRRRQIHRHAWR